MKSFRLLFLSLFLAVAFPLSAAEPALLVVLLGDSIRMNYQAAVKAELKGRADVWSPKDNCAHTAYTLQNLDRWLKEAGGKPAVVHINVGLHDMFLDAKSGRTRHTLETYDKNLRAIFAKLKEKTDARIIFALTTAVMEERQAVSKGYGRVVRRNEDVDRFNARAREIAEGMGIEVNDLNAFMKRNDPSRLLRDDGIHLSPEGCRIVGAEVASRILADGLRRTAATEGDLALFLRKSEMALQQVFKDERFPNLVVTLEGTLIATWGNKHVRVRRSEDGGLTWGPEITIANPGFHGGGTTVDENTGDILAFVEDTHPPAPLTIHRSRDDGRTWTAEKPVVHPDSRGNAPSMHMNEHGITLRHGPHKGRLLRPSRYYGKRNHRDEWPSHYTGAVYSDDGGRTWRTSDPFPENGTGEATMAELSDGRIYYNSRVHWQERPKNTRRREAWSRDGGHTWTDWRIVEILPDGHQHRSYGCMGGLVRLPVEDRDILVFSNIDTSRPVRERATVWASFDGGRTWPVKRLVHDGKSAYSSLNAGRPGTPSEGWIYLHFEGGPEGGSTVARFNLTWLLQGEPTGDGEVPEWVQP